MWGNGALGFNKYKNFDSSKMALKSIMETSARFERALQGRMDKEGCQS